MGRGMRRHLPYIAVTTRQKTSSAVMMEVNHAFLFLLCKSKNEADNSNVKLSLFISMTHKSKRKPITVCVIKLTQRLRISHDICTDKTYVFSEMSLLQIITETCIYIYYKLISIDIKLIL